MGILSQSDNDLPYIVRLLRGVREAHSWSQQDLARVLGVSRRTMIRWESGDPPPLYLQAALRELLVENVPAASAASQDTSVRGANTAGSFARPAPIG